MKKAFVDTPVWIILAVVFLIGGSGIILSLKEKIDETWIVTKCQESVYLNAERRPVGLETQFNQITCPTKYITLRRDKAEMEYESKPGDTSSDPKPVKLEDRVFKKDGKTCDKKDDACIFRNFNQVISEEIARCWYVFNKGEKRVFTVYDERPQCMVCSVIMFDDGVVQKYSDRGMIGFNNPEDEDYSLDLYMRNNALFKYTATENLYKYSMDLVDLYVGPLPYYDYTVSKDYAVVFIAHNKNNIKDLTDEAWEKLKPILLGQQTVSEDEGNFINSLEFIPNEDVVTRCGKWG